MKSSLVIKICFILFVSCFSPENINASNLLKYISNIDGLTNNSVNCILEDNEHTIWVGTWDGLNAFNGRDILTFRYSKSNLNSISNNIIRQLIEKEDYLWIATDNGINRLNKKTHQITRYYLQADNKIPNQEKSFILGNIGGKEIICFVRGKYLFRYDEQTDEFNPVKTTFTDTVKDYCTDDTGNIIFLFENGNVKYLNYNWIQGELREADLQSVSTAGPVNKIFRSNGTLILNEGNILYLFNPDFTVSHRVELDIRNSVSQTVLLGKKLYISFIEGGCIVYDLDEKTYSYLDELPRQLSVFTIYPGSQGILWIGTDGQGLAQLYSYNSIFRTVHTLHPVRSFCEVDDNILVGTKGSGVKLLNTETKRLSDFLDESKGLISNSVYTMRKNGSDDVFIGTEGAGINILEAGTGRLLKLKVPDKYPAFKAVYSICFTNNDSLLWIGTSGYGLIKMNISKEDGVYKVDGFRQYTSSDKNSSLNNDVVYAITSSPDDRFLWFGTRGGGLNRIDIPNNGICSLEDIDTNILLTNNDVLSLLYDENNIWIGTSYGLNRLDNQGSNLQLFQYANEQLNNKTIHGILKGDDGNIWFSTNQGLSNLNIPDNKIENYTFRNGLQNDEFSDGAYFKGSRGFLYFGGVSGLSYFNPQNMHLREFTPPLVLSSLKIYDSVQNIHDRIKQDVLKLNYEEKFVTFTFIAKDFINNDNCEYAYRLKNHSDNWIYVGNNPNIVFTQLPPGKYQLEVKSTNGDKVWGGNTYKLIIKMGYPWWFSIPALVVYGVLCLILFFITRSVIKNRIRLNRQVLIAQIEKQHEQKFYESRLNFFTNVAHEFFTPLTLIYTPVQYLLEQSGLDKETEKYLLIIKNNAERMQKLISELMEFRKTKSGNMDLHPENMEVESFIESVSGNYVDILKENKIDFKIDIHDTTQIYSDRNALEKIVFNLLSNAFKYTPGYGYIRLEAFQDATQNNRLHLIIRNSGKGLTEQQMAEIFDKFKIFDTPRLNNSVSNGIGLNLTKSLTELLGGEIKVNSELGKYVEFQVSIPSLSVDSSSIIIDEEVIQKEQKTGKEPELHKEVKVLIVEDEKNIRSLLKDILSDYTIREANNGLEALKEIEKNHPDIIISDMVMPDMDGITLIDHLKSDVKTSYIPIIGISAKASVSDQVNAYNHGADAYIGKPFHPRQIISTIENLLSRQALLKDYFNSSLSSLKVKDGFILHPEDEALIQNVTDFINENIDDEALSPSAVADFIGVSKATLYRKFKEIMDKTPSEFIRNIRLEYAAKLLRSTKFTVSEIMFKSGFSNKSYFYREFLKQYGVSPKDYRNQ
ncbi:response regulator [Parabacteroides sp. TM07-1AC]|uniref:hybrid sensor histidine kinase/response regulator transcription factor n=1 Tax=Parabacteroides sp. TM07-1AC TaxID=2292363 RepID=UPI000EFEF854|nr:response regulator [Parabacteroides sp. TM07-1AC]RHU22961.1 response regulator [Parabacteroides sp. TM07-1AC]